MVEIKYVPTICPYCGTGCGLNFVVKDEWYWLWTQLRCKRRKNCWCRTFKKTPCKRG